MSLLVHWNPGGAWVELSLEKSPIMSWERNALISSSWQVPWQIRWFAWWCCWGGGQIVAWPSSHSRNWVQFPLKSPTLAFSYLTVLKMELANNRVGRGFPAIPTNELLPCRYQMTFPLIQRKIERMVVFMLWLLTFVTTLAAKNGVFVHHGNILVTAKMVILCKCCKNKTSHSSNQIQNLLLIK